jgi:aminoglycoside phosphotransferase (APT) family kinase protein
VTADPEAESIALRAFPGARVLATHDLSGGISARAARIQLLTADAAEHDVVVRRPGANSLESGRRIANREYRVLQFASERQLRVPTPRYFDREAAALVIDHVAGDPDFAPKDLSRALEQMAIELAKLHQLRATEELYDMPRREEQLKDSLACVPETLDDPLNEAVVRARLSERFPWPNRNHDVLLHGDYWPGNLIWQDGELGAVIDWEQCSIGDPLADVALTRLDVLWAFGNDAMEAFTRHYQTHSALDWSNLPHWDLGIALRPMSKLAQWAPAYAPPPISRPDITAATMRDGHRRFVAQALANLPHR